MDGPCGKRQPFDIGVQYAYTPTVAIRLEVQKPARDTNNLSAGLLFKF